MARIEVNGARTRYDKRQRHALVIAAGDMVELSGGGHPDDYLHLLEPDLCAKLAKLAKEATK
jgi:hypothetical protein